MRLHPDWLDNSATKKRAAMSRQRSRALWPRQVRVKNGKVFARPVALNHDGKLYHIEIRSHGKEFFALWPKGGLLGKGCTSAKATLDLVHKIDPKLAFDLE